MPDSQTHTHITDPRRNPTTMAMPNYMTEPGNAYLDRAAYEMVDGDRHDAQTAALMAIAYELRTANLIAARTATQAGDLGEESSIWDRMTVWGG